MNNFIVPVILFGPVALLWITIVLKCSYNFIKYNSIFGEDHG